jgi:hypothetical protein
VYTVDACDSRSIGGSASEAEWRALAGACHTLTHRTLCAVALTAGSELPLSPPLSIMSSFLQPVKTRVNQHWAGAEPWRVARDTLLLTGAVWLVAKAIKAIRKKGLKKAILGTALSLVKSTSLGRGVVAAENEKLIKKLQAQVGTRLTCNSEDLC